MISAMQTKARKIILPRFSFTRIADDLSAPFEQVTLQLGSTKHSYPVQLVQDSHTRRRIDGRPSWMSAHFNLFPVILDSEGIPWPEAQIYLLSRLENAIVPVMSTFANEASDLAAYRTFLDEAGICWADFPQHKLGRPTYRYSGHLRHSVLAGELAASSAKRRMSTVIRFYYWLQDEGAFIPNYPAWRATDRYIDVRNAVGMKITKKVTVTDVSIPILKGVDPYSEFIEDGGKLRPLTVTEQEWVVNSLIELGNTEMTLIHLMGFLTGARIQSILTLRVRHVMPVVDMPLNNELRILTGPGTGIDTKNNKRIVLHIPVWFYQILRTYAHSERAKWRRLRAPGGDTPDQQLFLSVRGTPLYSTKETATRFNSENDLRHEKNGQGVRQFMTEKVIPFIQKNHSANFKYRFHDTRASYGMNITDYQLGLVEKGEITLHQARESVRMKLSHESSATTDLYIGYRQNLRFVRAVASEWDSHLRMLSGRIDSCDA